MAESAVNYKELNGALDNLLAVFKKPRSGIIVNQQGTRVGQWKWTRSRMLLVGEATDFQKLVKHYQKEGVPISTYEVAPSVPTENDLELDLQTATFVIKMKPLVDLLPGQLDLALKLKGYYLMDYNLPIGADTE